MPHLLYQVRTCLHDPTKMNRWFVPISPHASPILKFALHMHAPLSYLLLFFYMLSIDLGTTCLSLSYVLLLVRYIRRLPCHCITRSMKMLIKVKKDKPDVANWLVDLELK